MELKVVTTDKGRVFVDESAEIFGGNQYVDDTGLIRKAIIYDRDYWLQRPEYNRIIATIDFSLDKYLPMVIVEDEAMKLSISKGLELYNGGNYDFENGVRVGYKAAQQKGVYTEDDMKEAFHQGMCNVDNDGCYIDDVEFAFKECIDYLNKECEERMELEMEMKQYKTGVKDGSVEEFCYEENRIKTDRRLDGQIIAYIKKTL